jgi:hypothetical protein
MDQFEMIASYAPYGIDFLDQEDKLLKGSIIYKYMCLNDLYVKWRSHQITPILHPFSEAQKLITREITAHHLGETHNETIVNLFDYNVTGTSDLYFIDPTRLPYYSFRWLLQGHFDVYGLIPSGMAISYSDYYAKFFKI